MERPDPFFGETTMNALLAWAGPTSITQWLIAVVILAACVALVIVALRQFNISIPAWVQQVFWIIVVAAVVVGAIRLVMTL